MKTGFRGTFVISWKQTDLDGLEAAPLDALTVGAVWSWRGECVRVDGPTGLLCLDRTNDEETLRKSAARKVRRMVGAAIQNRTDIDDIEIDDPLMDRSFVVTNGAQSFTVTLIDAGNGGNPLLMFVDEIPPRETDLWVVHHTLDSHSPDFGAASPGGVICFTPGTRITTPNGSCLVEDLREGDLVQTRDSGPQEIQWIGQRRMSGARLFVMPELRPIRFRADALGGGRPDGELLVSPEHRMLIKGAVAVAWLGLSGHEWLGLWRGYAVSGALRVHAGGQVEWRRPDGTWASAALCAGSVVLPRIAWLRVAPADGRHFAELVCAQQQGSEEWRRLQVIWRHIGAA